jgi:hypothetical protein
VSGTATPSQDTEIFDAATGGRAFAHFAGAEVPVSEAQFPADAATGRASISTGSGRGNFHVSGFVNPAKIPVYTTTRVAVVADHLWIGEGRQVTVLGAEGAHLKVSRRLTSPIDQTFIARAACSALALSATTPPGWNVPGFAHGYVVKRSSVELFDSSSGKNTVTTLRRAASAPGILLWSTEQRADWVHVEFHGEVIIDAWARTQDLEALAPGETMDQLAGPAYSRSSQHLALAGQPRVVRTTQQVPLFAKASATGASIGWIEPDTDTYVIDTMAGWVSVMPKSLNVVPSGDGHFWVKSADFPRP